MLRDMRKDIIYFTAQRLLEYGNADLGFIYRSVQRGKRLEETVGSKRQSVSRINTWIEIPFSEHASALCGFSVAST